HRLGQRFPVAARLWPEDDAAMAPVWGACASLPGAAGALLPPGFPAAAANLAALLRVGRALPRVCLFRQHRLMDQRYARLDAENGFGERQAADFLAFSVVEGHLWHLSSPIPAS